MWLSTKCHNVALYTNAVEITSMNLIRQVKFPDDEPERSAWIAAMPNNREQLLKKKEIWVYHTHFEGPWKTVQGGKRPVNAPSIFPGVPKSCVKQVQSKRRSTSCTNADARQKEQQQKTTK